MKKKLLLIISVLMIVVSVVTCFACTTPKEEKVYSYTMVAPDGAPALAMASILKNNNISDTVKIDANIVNASTIAAEALKANFAILPINAAAKLYNSGKDIKVLASVTNGNLFIVSSIDNTNFKLEDLKGKMFYSIGQAQVPSAILKYVLTKNNIEYVEDSETAVEGKVAIKYCQDGAALMPMIVGAKNKGEEVYGLLAEPAVSTGVKAGKLFKVGDVQEMYKTATNSTTYGFAQAVLVSIGDVEKASIASVIKYLSDNDNYVVDNLDEAKEVIINNYESTSLANISANAIAGCNIKTYSCSTNKEYIMATLNAIYEIDASLIKSVPDKDSGFYYHE